MALNLRQWQEMHFAADPTIRTQASRAGEVRYLLSFYVLLGEAQSVTCHTRQAVTCHKNTNFTGCNLLDKFGVVLCLPAGVCMLLGALLCAEAGLTPWAKYVLVRLVQCFDLGQPVELNVKGLAKQFGITDGQVTKALKNLEACNILRYTSAAAGRGRPKRLFSLQEQHLQQFRGIGQLEPHQHLQAICSLLQHEDSRPAPQVSHAEESSDKDALSGLRARKKPERLSVLNRLLLAVLLFYADRMGVVRDIGFTDLSRLTCLSSERLKYRVKRLVELELIRAWIPGVTSCSLLGKAKSVYFLNLRGPVFESGYSLAWIMIYGWVSRFREAASIIEDIDEHLAPGSQEKSSLSDLDSKGETSSAVLVAERRQVAPLLQVRLESYSSWLLSYCWESLGAPDFSCPRELYDRIMIDFSGVCLRLGKEGCDEFVRYIYGKALSLASRVRSSLLYVPDNERRSIFSYQDFLYLILPHDPRRKKARSEEGRCFRSVLVFSKARSAFHGCLKATRGGVGFSRTIYIDESEIPKAERYEFGLINSICSDSES